MTDKKFALIGASGYVAPRHMHAIKETNNDLVATLDINDSVGILDKYFSQAHFFTQFERFERHLEKLKRARKKIDYLSICSPNHLHDFQIRFGLKYGANVICEKPLALNPWNVEAIESIEKECGTNVFSILQLRLHDSVIKLKEKIASGPKDKVYDIELTYITSRGSWYYSSWKGDDSKSGGIETNIGIHFFDMLSWIFGKPTKNVLHLRTFDRSSGYTEFKNARVRWFLSINEETLPNTIKEKGLKTFRSLKIENNEWDFSKGFEDLHLKSYQEILSGNGFKTKEAKTSIQIVHEIRTLEPIGLKGDYHPFAKKAINQHPHKI